MTRRPPPAQRRRPASTTATASLGAWLALWALLLPIALPLGQAVPLGGTGADHRPRTLVVCTADGGWRTIALPGATGQNQSQGSQGHGCAVCLAYAAGGLLTLPPVAVLPFPPAAGAELPTPAPSHLSGGLRPGLPQPRGPPALLA